MCRAAEIGDVNKLQTDLAGNIDVNGTDSKGRTALILAVQHGHLDAVKALLAHGASPNKSDAHGATPLIAAHFRGNFAILTVLEHQGH